MQVEAAIAKKPQKKAIIIGAAILVAFAVLFALLLTMYNSENQAVVTQYMQEETSKSGYISISAKSFSVDPVKGEISTRLQFTPAGDLLNEDGTLAKNMTVYINSSTGKTQIPFKKGELMNPVDAVIDIYGNVGAYPFDSHEGTLYISLIENVTNDQGVTTDGDAVPFTVDYTSTLAGYKMNATQTEDSQSGYVGLDLQVSRSSTALTFAIFIMALEWLLALSPVGATFVWVKGRKIEVGMFGWMGALLFALVPLRNAMPAVPPVGVLSDIVSFFWAEIIVAVCLVVSVFTWLKRGSAEGRAK